MHALPPSHTATVLLALLVWSRGHGIYGCSPVVELFMHTSLSQSHDCMQASIQSHYFLNMLCGFVKAELWSLKREKRRKSKKWSLSPNFKGIWTLIQYTTWIRKGRSEIAKIERSNMFLCSVSYRRTVTNDKVQPVPSSVSTIRKLQSQLRSLPCLQCVLNCSDIHMVQ